jgi:hypothetical protein
MPTAAALRQFLQGKLPSHMVPSSLRVVAALPMTPSGKVDRRSLSALPGEESGAADGAPPRTPVEELVAGLFAELLHGRRVGREDDFFELGGHSLLATQLASRLRDLLGVELPLRAVFEQPKVAGLALRMEEALRGATGPAAPPLRRVPREGAAGAAADLPLSFAQQRLWFIDQLEGGSFYNVPVALRMSGQLSYVALTQVLAEVVRRHEVLRTVFRGDGGQARQVIQPAAEVVIPLVDLTALPAASRERVARDKVTEEARRPFDLARGPLLRARLWRLGESENLLLFTLHHIASDAWSLGVLVREVTTLYAAFALGRPSPLAELAVQYADFAAWQRAGSRGRCWRARSSTGAGVWPARRPPSNCRSTGRGRRCAACAARSAKAPSHRP